MAASAADCTPCALAQANPDSGHVNAGCQECRIRELAKSPGFHASMVARRMTPQYRQALEVEFGEDWEAGHRRVKACGAAMDLKRVERAERVPPRGPGP